MTQQPADSGFLNTAVNLLSRIIGRRRQPAANLPTVDTAAFQRYADYFDQQSSDLADQLANKYITLERWQVEMEKAIDSLHMTAHVIGVGGIDNMTADDLAQVLATTENQKTYLRAWAVQLRTQIADGTVNYGAVKSRARLYRNAADATLQQATLAHVGIPDLPAVPRDGSTICLVNCACQWDIRRVEGGYDCYWTLNPAEHCDTCLARAQVWNPLMIRGGVIQPYDTTGLFAEH